MTIIRGATTIEKDDKPSIVESVKALLDEIFQVNALQKAEIKVLVFSLTSDIHSYHPAKAARECGYDFAPLFSATEPDIDGGLIGGAALKADDFIALIREALAL